jgi:predicted polyphosphate/ATP-dependent NAD kinase
LSTLYRASFSPASNRADGGGITASTSTATVGLIANPASGKDIRRLVAHAGVVGNDDKVNILRRVLSGLAASGVRRVLAMPDPYRLVARAADGLDGEGGVEVAYCSVPGAGGEEDTIAAARAVAEAGVACLITLGGDGTNRAAARGTCAVPVVAISTGTNNVFPSLVEGTAAGLAAGAVAAGCVDVNEVAHRAKVLRLSGGCSSDRSHADENLALIDVVVLDPGFVGARAIWEMKRVRRVLLTRASAAAMGMAALGGAVRRIGAEDPIGLDLQIGTTEPADHVRVAIAPGMVVPVALASVADLLPGEPVAVPGPCLLALDGERDVVVSADRTVTVALCRDGPPVVDVERCLELAAERGFFRGETVWRLR